MLACKTQPADAICIAPLGHFLSNKCSLDFRRVKPWKACANEEPVTYWLDYEEHNNPMDHFGVVDNCPNSVAGSVAKVPAHECSKLGFTTHVIKCLQGMGRKEWDSLCEQAMRSAAAFRNWCGSCDLFSFQDWCAGQARLCAQNIITRRNKITLSFCFLFDKGFHTHTAHARTHAQTHAYIHHPQKHPTHTSS